MIEGGSGGDEFGPLILGEPSRLRTAGLVDRSAGISFEKLSRVLSAPWVIRQ